MTDSDDEFKVFTCGKKVEPSLIIDPGFVDIARVEGGGSLGALALIDGKPRMATMKALTRCHFISISMPQYQKALDMIARKKEAKRVNFIKNIPLFSKLTRTYLGKFSRSF